MTRILVALIAAMSGCCKKPETPFLTEHHFSTVLANGHNVYLIIKVTNEWHPDRTMLIPSITDTYGHKYTWVETLEDYGNHGSPRRIRTAPLHSPPVFVDCIIRNEIK